MKFNKNKEEDSTFEMDMTPMIDVTFLLIIFFMLTASFSNQLLTEGILLPDASESTPDDAPARIVINVKSNGTFELRGVTYAASSLESKILAYSRARDEIDGLSSAIIMIRADKSSPYGAVQDVYAMAQKGRIYNVSIATQKKR